MNFDQYLAQKRDEYGDAFDASDLAPAFRAYFGTRIRVKVLTSYGEEITGTVSATTGHRPAFLLMRRRNSVGSSDLLSVRDRVIAVQYGHKYVAV